MIGRTDKSIIDEVSNRTAMKNLQMNDSRLGLLGREYRGETLWGFDDAVSTTERILSDSSA